MIIKFDILFTEKFEVLKLIGEYASNVKRDNFNETIKYAVNKKENSLEIIIIGPGAIGIAGLRISTINNEGLLKLIIKPFIEKGAVVLMACILISMTILLSIKGINLASIMFFNSIFLVFYFIIYKSNIMTIKKDIVPFLNRLKDKK